MKTEGGVSRRGRPAVFRYRLPRDVTRSTYEPAPRTVTATDVAWVIGGTDVANPRAGEVEPWTVGLRPGSVVPDVGDPYFVRPGTAAFPSGLAGTVTAIADQADGGIALTVAPTSLNRTLDDVHIDFAGPIGEPLPPVGTAAVQDQGVPGRRDSVVSRGVELGVMRPNAFRCKDRGGQQATFRGELGVRLENVHAGYQADMGGLFRDPYLSVWVSGETVVYGKVSVSSKITCNLRPAFANSRRRVFPIGATGATVSFGPSASFSVSGSGTSSIEQRTSRMVGFETTGRGRLKPINVSHEHKRQATADGTFRVSLDGGVDIQAGMLDRVGFLGRAGIGLSASARASGPPPRVCVTLGLSLKTSIGAYLDLWIARWEAKSFERTVDLARTPEACTGPEPPVPADSDPVIASGRLRDATNGTSYRARLATVDGRQGTWSMASGSLPTGLTLNESSGVISGTPNAAVRDHSFNVRFTDADSRSTVSIVHIYVRALVLSGGDVQVSLTWPSAADLDLHVVDPDGDEIWYSDTGPTDEGGYLDHDANAGCGERAPEPAENIVWPSGRAPSGTYQARVVVFDTCDAADLDWHLVVRVGGRVVLDEDGTGDSEVFEVGVGGNRNRVVRRAAPDPSWAPKA